MKHAKPLLYKISALAILIALLAAMLVGCQPAAPVTTETAPAGSETQTISTAALEASPTVSPDPPVAPTSAVASPTDATAACPLPDPRVYARPEGDFCLAYPEGFTLDEAASANQLPEIRGPAREEGPNAIRAFLDIETPRPVPPGANLERMVEEYLTGSMFQDLPWTVTQTQTTLSGEPAIALEGIPGLGSMRQVLALHNGALYTLNFGYIDFPQVAADLNDLYGLVMWSFTFLEGGPGLPTAAPETVSWSEFDRSISFAWDPPLAMVVDTWPVPAVPLSENIMYAEAHPSYLGFRFLGYQGGQTKALPYPITGAQLIAMPASEFAGYAGEGPTGFPQQLAALQPLLQDRPDLAAKCAAAPSQGELRLPFLPWVNSAQVFCAQPGYVEFEGGSGIRYLTAFSQGVAELTDPMLFYTFQGLSDDSEIYLSGIFPVRSGLLPEQPPATTEDLEDLVAAWDSYLEETLQKLNAVPTATFSPSLETLDALIQGIEVKK